MMQAAGNPLLGLLTGAGIGATPSAAGPQGQGPELSASGFASLFAASQNAQANVQVIGSNAAGQGSPLTANLKQVLPVLENVKAEVSALESLPSDVTEGILETLDQLSEFIGNWIEGEPINAEELSAVLPDGLVEALPEGFAEALTEKLGKTFTLDQAPPVVMVHVLQQATLSLVSDISAAVTGEAVVIEAKAKPINLGSLAVAIGQIQKSLSTATPGQHPVVIASQLDQLGEGLGTLVAEDLNVELDGENIAASRLISTSGAAGGKGATAMAFGDFIQRIAASPAHTAGAIDIPKDMVQIIPEELATAVHGVSETQSSAAQAQQVSARSDAPQAKFTQAVIGQLRSVDFQEGTTRVELNPRGLGNVEIEMKTNVDGSLSVVVRAESAHVLSSLRNESDLLAQIIAQGGDAAVDFQEFSSEDQQSFDNQSAFGGEVGTDEDGDEITTDTTEAHTIGNGQLDLMT